MKFAMVFNRPRLALDIFSAQYTTITDDKQQTRVDYVIIDYAVNCHVLCEVSAVLKLLKY